MYTKMIRSFLPVGQGAFYSECFKSYRDDTFNIVYDCGSSTGIGFVKQAIINNFEQGEKIDALFLSHLDEDHINGIPELLKYCNVEKIFFPVISPNDKILMKIDFLVRGVSGFTRAFLEDPQEAIRELKLEKEIPKLVEVLTEKRNNELGYDDEVNAERPYVYSGEDVLNQEKRNRMCISRLDWLFIPYNFRQEERVIQLKENLKEKFGGEINDAELESLWKNGTAKEKEKIKQAYGAISGGLNVNSMTLFSGTKDYRLGQKLIECHTCCHYKYMCRFRPSGCLYTGDYDASGKDKWSKLSLAYKEYRDHIGCIQIPHHGAKGSFNNKFLYMNRNCFYVISAGSNNKYQHPHSVVIKKFLFKGIMPFIVSEQVNNAKHFSIYEW